MEARILDQFRAIVGDRGLISSPEELHTYECDGLTNIASCLARSCCQIPQNMFRGSFEFVTVNESRSLRAAPARA